MLLSIDSIKIPMNRRGTDQAKIRELMDSIKEIGLLNPVTITKDHVLIAGLHRLKAFQELGKTEIECNIRDLEGLKAELAEIDENLIRNELHYIDRGEQLRRRKEIYEELYPETKAGKSQAKAMNKAIGNNVSADSAPTFVQDTAKKTGASARVIHEELQIAKNIIPEVKEVIKAKEINKSDAIKIARMEPEKQKKVAEALETGEAKKFLQAVRIAKREEYEERVKNNELPNGKYRIIYVDPPWQYNNSGLDGYGHAENYYQTMSIEEICNMPIKELLEENAVLFLWVTSPMLEDAFKVINSWGFKYKSSFVWDKVKKNFGYYNAVCHEFLLVGVRGNCTPDNPKLFDSVITIEHTGRHSEKPEYFRQMIDELYPVGNRIELFARKPGNEKWEVWGNKV
jgi:N6-adenosine-specific RNA methylase IME4/ParB-like chromosome segregation protein Spo0J